MLSHKMTADGLDWHVSRTCDNGQCVKVARDGEIVVIGNTNNPEGPFSECTAEEWRHFLAGAKLGDFDGIALRPHIRMMRKGPADVAGPFASKATWVTCCTGATAESRG